MQCWKCRSENDPDALFCEQCGRPLRDAVEKGRTPLRSPYLLAILLAAAAAVVAGIGYYRFFLPGGVAAVVNGEKITLAELDGVVRSSVPGGAVPAGDEGRMRYHVLSRLVTERIAEQEARKAGVRAAPGEVDEALSRAQQSSGMNRDGFERMIDSRYGSMSAYRGVVARQLTVRKFIAERLAPGISDPAVVNGRVEQWLQEISGRAVVRISLEEQLPGSGCGGGCCGAGNNGPQTRGCDPSRRPGTGSSGASLDVKAAGNAALAYWRERHGDDPVEAKVTDRGCHLQVDLMQGAAIAQSLRYQNGTITEL